MSNNEKGQVKHTTHWRTFKEMYTEGDKNSGLVVMATVRPCREDSRIVLKKEEIHI